MDPTSADDTLQPETTTTRTAAFCCAFANCHRIYHRKEHLARHERSQHMRLCPYVCNICERRFGRTDVLKRHLDQHSKRLGTSKRAVNACDRCHRRKSKCDGGEPCAGCAESKHACVRTRKNLRLGTLRSPASSPECKAPSPEVSEPVVDLPRDPQSSGHQLDNSWTIPVDFAANMPIFCNDGSTSWAPASDTPESLLLDSPSEYAETTVSEQDSCTSFCFPTFPEAFGPNATNQLAEVQMCEQWCQTWDDAWEYVLPADGVNQIGSGPPMSVSSMQKNVSNFPVRQVTGSFGHW